MRSSYARRRYGRPTPVVAAPPVDTRTHAEAGGQLCTDDGTGCCRECGVSLGEQCERCLGRGYHFACCSLAEAKPAPPPSAVELTGREIVGLIDEADAEQARKRAGGGR